MEMSMRRGDLDSGTQGFYDPPNFQPRTGTMVACLVEHFSLTIILCLEINQTENSDPIESAIELISCDSVNRIGHCPNLTCGHGGWGLFHFHEGFSHFC